ncbi:GNAT family N-acetyltransferase [Clostridioides difficile]|nr:GNAT family N-acetyltransferase [Clostridioides difficile]
MKLEITEKVEKQDEDVIFQGLLEYNLANLENKNPVDLGIYTRDKTGQILAGLIGVTHGNWLSIKYLWVSEKLRYKGIGSQLLHTTEKIAKERGCKYAFLDTFSFQAPKFYEKFGYNKVYALENYPITGKRYYFTKVL